MRCTCLFYVCHILWILHMKKICLLGFASFYKLQPYLFNRICILKTKTHFKGWFAKWPHKITIFYNQFVKERILQYQISEGCNLKVSFALFFSFCPRLRKTYHRMDQIYVLAFKSHSSRAMIIKCLVLPTYNMKIQSKIYKIQSNWIICVYKHRQKSATSTKLILKLI